MEKKIFMLLGLHLLTETKLFYVIVLIGIAEVILMLTTLKKRGYFVEVVDYFILSTGISGLSYVLFLSEHLTFFSCIFYNNLYLFMIYGIYGYIKYKCNNKVD